MPHTLGTSYSQLPRLMMADPFENSRSEVPALEPGQGYLAARSTANEPRETLRLLQSLTQMISEHP